MDVKTFTAMFVAYLLSTCDRYEWCVLVSVTYWYRVKTNEHRTVQFSSWCTPVTIFWHQISYMTPCSTWCLIITLANVDRFSKFFLQVICRKIMYTSQWFLLHLQDVATLSCESRKSKNVTDFYSTSTDYWHVLDDILTTWFNLTVVRHTVSRLLILTDWLTFWSLSDDVSNQQLNLIQLHIVASWRFFHHDHLCTAFILSSQYFVFCTHI